MEEWFFHRLKAGRPIPVPNSGVQITQLGHVKVGKIAHKTTLYLSVDAQQKLDLSSLIILHLQATIKTGVLNLYLASVPAYPINLIG